MNYISGLHNSNERTAPFPFSVPAIRYAKEIEFRESITFIVGDNGTGKSTLLETIAMKLNLPLIGGFINSTRGFEAAGALQSHIDMIQNKDSYKGFFFRAEDGASRCTNL